MSPQLEKIYKKIEYYQREIVKLQTAVDVIKSLDIDSGQQANHVIVNNGKNSLPTIKLKFNAGWSHAEKIVFFLREIGHCALPKEIEQKYLDYGQDVKSSNVNQFLMGVRDKELIASYKPNFPSKAFAWGLVEWFDGDNPKPEYEAKKPKPDLFK